MPSITLPAPENRQQYIPWLVVLAGLCALYLPTFTDLMESIWATEAQAHGPIVLIVSVWLLWRKWPEIIDIEGARPRPGIAWPIIIVAALFYAFGRSQGILLFEVGSLIWMLVGLLLLLRGTRALKAVWFPLLFMLFMIPLPSTLVDALTQPMKLAVSTVVEAVLFNVGYPIARSGVILEIGQYQLLVADACAGLQTLFTLESMGLLYLNLVRHSSALRNVMLAILIIPISFVANVIRVIILTLITYYWGDEAGQGFLHGFAGMVLFISALLLIIGADSFLRMSARVKEGALNV
jgi:exosortase B